MLVLRMIVALVLHLMGDYVLQRALHSKVPHKRASTLGMVLHSVYAEALCGFVVGLFDGLAMGCVHAIVCVLCHYLIDSNMPVRKTRLLSAVDQALHMASLFTFFLYTI